MTEQTITKEMFKAHAESIRGHSCYRDPTLWGLFVAQHNRDEEIISGHFLTVNYKEHYGSAALLLDNLQIVDSEQDMARSELVAPLDYSDVTDALHWLDCYKYEAKGDKHLNLQSLMAIEAEYNVESEPRYYAVFIFDDTVPAQSIAPGYLRMEAYDKGLGETFCADGLKDVLKEMLWEGNKATDPDDWYKVLAEGPRPMWEKEPHRLPPYLRTERLDEGFLRLIERNG